MTGSKRDQTKELMRLVDGFVEDVLSRSDDEIIAEAKADGGDVNATADGVRSLLAGAIRRASKGKLETARAAVRNASARTDTFRVVGSLEEKRRLLQETIARHKGLDKSLTLAARNADEMLESDLDSMLQDLADLGMMEPEDKSK